MALEMQQRGHGKESVTREAGCSSGSMTVKRRQKMSLQGSHGRDVVAGKARQGNTRITHHSLWPNDYNVSLLILNTSKNQLVMLLVVKLKINMCL